MADFVLQQRALLFRDTELSNALMLDYRTMRLESFTTSRGQLKKLLKRDDRYIVSLSWELRSLGVTSVACEMTIFTQKTRGNDVSCIFTVEETGIFYKALPRQT